MDKYKIRPGIAPASFKAYCLAAEGAGIDLKAHPKLRLTQTMGTNVAASAGTHARDGYFTLGGKRYAYSAAFDISVLWLTIPQIRTFLDHLAWWGVPAWYRPWVTNGRPNYHIHAISCHVPMKDILDAQVSDFLNDRTGLKGHAIEKFYTAGVEQDNYIRALWRWSNKGGPLPPNPPKAPRAAPPAPEYFQNLWKVHLSGRYIGDAVAIDGNAWFPVRPWYNALGINVDSTGRQLVKWAPENNHVYVQGRELDADVKLLTIAGNRQGYLRIRDLARFSDLDVKPYEKERKIEVTRKPKSGA